ncbi:MAG: hypothetical protein U0N90_13255 [Blautia sp.]
MKKRLLGILVGAMIIGNTLSVYADTITFDVTVNAEKFNEDNYSRKVNKSGGAAYENRFYVTPTSFPIRNIVNAYSRQENNINKTSYPCSLKPGKENITMSNPYVGDDAPANQIYRLHAYFGGDTGSARVLGRFTP